MWLVKCSCTTIMTFEIVLQFIIKVKACWIFCKTEGCLLILFSLPVGLAFYILFNKPSIILVSDSHDKQMEAVFSLRRCCHVFYRPARKYAVPFLACGWHCVFESPVWDGCHGVMPCLACGFSLVAVPCSCFHNDIHVYLYLLWPLSVRTYHWKSQCRPYAVFHLTAKWHSVPE